MKILTNLILFGISYKMQTSILNYQQIYNIIEIIKENVSEHNNNPKHAKDIYTALFNYLNYAGGNTIIPNILQPYINILTMFHNTEQTLTWLNVTSTNDTFFDNHALKQEIQTIMLLWLRAAANTPLQNIDLTTIVKQYHTKH